MTEKENALPFGRDILEPGRREGDLGRDSPVGIEFEHLVEQVQGRAGNEGKLFADTAPVGLFGLERVPERQLDDRRPDGRTRSATGARDQIELLHFLRGLKDGFLEEELAEDAAAGPDVDGRAIALLAEKQFGRSVPQRDDFIGVGSLLVLGVVEARQTKVCQFDLAQVVHEDVAALDVAMKEIFFVTVIETVE